MTNTQLGFKDTSKPLLRPSTVGGALLGVGVYAGWQRVGQNMGLSERAAQFSGIPIILISAIIGGTVLEDVDFGNAAFGGYLAATILALI